MNQKLPPKIEFAIILFLIIYSGIMLYKQKHSYHGVIPNPEIGSFTYYK